MKKSRVASTIRKKKKATDVYAVTLQPDDNNVLDAAK